MPLNDNHQTTENISTKYLHKQQSSKMNSTFTSYFGDLIALSAQLFDVMWRFIDIFILLCYQNTVYGTFWFGQLTVTVRLNSSEFIAPFRELVDKSELTLH